MDIDLLKKQIEGDYDFGNIVSLMPLGSGVDSSCYTVTTDENQYVAKIYGLGSFSADYVAYESEIMNICNNQGLLVPRVYTSNNNTYYSRLDDKFVQVSDFVDGNKDGFRQITIKIVGEQMGKLHTGLSVYSEKFEKRIRKSLRSDLQYFNEIEDYFQPANHQKKVGDLIQEIFIHFHNTKKHYRNLPLGIIHNDMHYDNMACKEGKLLGFFDFTDVTISWFIQDIAIFIGHLYWSPQSQRDFRQSVQYFFEGYQKYRKLNSFERTMLIDFMGYRAVQNLMEGSYKNFKKYENNRKERLLYYQINKDELRRNLHNAI